MLWWIWLLLMWSALALVLGVVLGGVIRTADRREVGANRGADEQPRGVRLPTPRLQGQVGGQSVGRRR
ncbi:hypothetical protein LY71_11015 [Geodermatophilus tzadiensis]|uniref:Uncharacterized protein n=1 Tax=Geodermatophilus tzadiensis TaxID=1137988 RepID=A0A2T0TR55_9ACTN|nr:hypothetical protein LY71_11015 [Geodermatophilus tzadiensis]